MFGHPESFLLFYERRVPLLKKFNSLKEKGWSFNEGFYYISYNVILPNFLDNKEIRTFRCANLKALIWKNYRTIENICSVMIWPWNLIKANHGNETPHSFLFIVHYFFFINCTTTQKPHRWFQFAEQNKKLMKSFTW